MKKSLSIVGCAFLFLAVSCSRTDNSFRDKFRWISGKWVGKQGETEIVEMWRWNKTRFEGHGFNVNKGDTLVNEALFMADYNGKTGYTVVVNGRGPYTFSLTEGTESRHVFTNPEHDFPSVICYEQEGDTAMTVTLFSNENLEEPAIEYRLTRFVK